MPRKPFQDSVDHSAGSSEDSAYLYLDDPILEMLVGNYFRENNENSGGGSESSKREWTKCVIDESKKRSGESNKCGQRTAETAESYVESTERFHHYRSSR